MRSMSLTLEYTPDSCLQSEEEISRRRERKEVNFRSLQPVRIWFTKENNNVHILHLSHAVVCRNAMVATSLNVPGHNVISNLDGVIFLIVTYIVLS